MKSRLIQNLLNVEMPAIASAEGVWLTDTGGKHYLDACSGAVVALIGHGDPRVLAAMKDQGQKVTFTHRGAFTSIATQTLANRIGELTGYPGVWFVNSGSEAVEAAMQFALQYYRELGHPERQWFLSSGQGYHGNTLGGLSLSGHSRRNVAGTLAYDFATLPTPYTFRDAGGRTDTEYTADLLRRARMQFETHQHHLAGIVIEPVGGATLGATVPPKGYLDGLRALCDEFDVLFIADEVMTGFGRTGRMLASEHFGVVPDLVATGKGLGAGYTPIAATLVCDRVLDAIESGSGRIYGGHTYAANPLSIAIAAAVLDVLITDGLVERGDRMAAILRAGLMRLAASHPIVADVRGVGMLLAIELATRGTALTEGTATEGMLTQGMLSARVVAAAMQHGAIIYGVTGGFNDAALIAPPLTITENEIDALIAALDAALDDVEAGLDAGAAGNDADRHPQQSATLGGSRHPLIIVGP